MIMIEHNKKLQDLKAKGIATIAGRLFRVINRLMIVKLDNFIIISIKLYTIFSAF